MSSITCTQTKNVHLLTTASKKIIKYQNIAPAMCPTSYIHSPNDNDENKSRKYSQRILTQNSDPTQSVLRRNARERNRVKQVNNSFARLRQHIPQTIIADLTKSGGRGPHKKISKVDTLRIAVEYIRRLQNLLDDLNGGSNSCSSQVSFNKNSRNAMTSYSALREVEHKLKTYTSNKSIQHQAAAITKRNTPTNANTNTNTNTLSENNHPMSFNGNTILLSPISLNSFSPQPKNSTHTNVDNNCNSPTSSFNSNLSADSSNYDHNLQSEQKQSIDQGITEGQSSLLVENTHLQLKFEPYDNFHLSEDNCTPDDEEILDYISLWQDQ